MDIQKIVRKIKTKSIAKLVSNPIHIPQYVEITKQFVTLTFCRTP